MSPSEADRATLRRALEALGACAPCTLRFLGVPASDAEAYRAAAAADAADASADTCPCCLGVLQLDPDATVPAPSPSEPEAAPAPTATAAASTAAADDDDAPPPRVVAPRVAARYAAGAREGGHEVTTFALEVTMPPALAVREAATRLRLAEALRGGSETNEREDADAESRLPDAADAAEVFSALVVPALERPWKPLTTSDDKKLPPHPAYSARTHDPDSDFRFALLFEHPLSASEAAFAYRAAAAASNADAAKGNGHKNGRRRGAKRPPPSAYPPHFDVAKLPEAPEARWRFHRDAYDAARRGSSGAPFAKEAFLKLKGSGFGSGFGSDARVAPLARATVRMLCWHRPAYVGGRYLKYARGTPQSPWFADGGEVGRGSVQTSLDAVLLSPAFLHADGSKLNSAGREDMDVRMLGNGRPFILEAHNPRRPRCFDEGHDEVLLDSADDDPERIVGRGASGSGSSAAARAAALSSSRLGDGGVGVVGVHRSSREAYGKMHEGSAEKEKTYAAVMWASRRLGAEDFARLNATKGLRVAQATPTRVLHRRAPATRTRVVHEMRAAPIEGDPSGRFFTLEMRTQAGTYVKEFAHGDFGRTRPSVGELLGCEADILQLDVTDVEMRFAGRDGAPERAERAERAEEEEEEEEEEEGEGEGRERGEGGGGGRGEKRRREGEGKGPREATARIDIPDDEMSE